MEREALELVATTALGRDSERGEYLTDGFRLYRVVISRVFHEERLVELEDCRTLDVCVVPADQLSSLRRVRPADPRPSGPPDSTPSWLQSRPGW